MEDRQLRVIFVQIGNIRNFSTDAQSSATLKILSPSSCLRVVWAGLYWTAYVPIADRHNPKIEKVKFKMPGDTQFLDLQADAHMYSNFAIVEMDIIVLKM